MLLAKQAGRSWMQSRRWAACAWPRRRPCATRTAAGRQLPRSCARVPRLPKRRWCARCSARARAGMGASCGTTPRPPGGWARTRWRPTRAFPPRSASSSRSCASSAGCSGVRLSPSCCGLLCIPPCSGHTLHLPCPGEVLGSCYVRLLVTGNAEALRWQSVAESDIADAEQSLHLLQQYTHGQRGQELLHTAECCAKPLHTPHAGGCRRTRARRPCPARRAASGRPGRQRCRQNWRGCTRSWRSWTHSRATRCRQVPRQRMPCLQIHCPPERALTRTAHGCSLDACKQSTESVATVGLVIFL